MILYKRSMGIPYFSKKIDREVLLFLIVVLLILLTLSTYALRGRIKAIIVSTIDITAEETKSQLFSYTHLGGKFYLDINLKNLRRIEFSRERNLEQHVGSFVPEDWVPGTIRFNDETYKIKIRLKGIDRNHWEGAKKWSFRVKVSDGKSILGMKTFTLQRSELRGGAMEWLLMKALTQEGLIAHKVYFLEAFLNGESWGLYAAQDQYDKLIIERSGHREGPIIGFDKGLQFKAENQGSAAKSIWEMDSFWRAPIGVIQQRKTMADPRLATLAQTGIQLLEGFRDGSVSASQVFETKSLAKTIAIRAALGAAEFDWRDGKFYVNPITLKLHLVTREIHFFAGDKYRWWLTNSENSEIDQRSFHNLFFRDPIFLAEYLRQLKRIADEDYITDLIDSTADELKAINDSLGFGRHLTIPKVSLMARAELAQAALAPPQGVLAYLNKKTTDYIDIRVGNIQQLPVKLGCLYNGEEEISCQEKNAIIDGKFEGEPAEYRLFRFELAPKIGAVQQSTLRLHHHLPGLASRPMKAPLIPFDIRFKEAIPRDLNKNLLDNLGDKRWLKIDKGNKQIQVVKGIWEVRENLILPPGYVMSIQEGTTLLLFNGASIISQSKLDWKGTKDDPIIIRSPDFTGHGIFVQDAEGVSEISNVWFSQLSAPKQEEWNLSGAVTFYQSDINIISSTFDGNVTGDDYLNVVRSHIDISDTRFSNTLADAVDIDFCTGSIHQLEFINIGNDAIDASGSQVIAKNVVMQKIGDKGISVGENSTFEVRDLAIKNAAIGIAVKDNSHLYAVNVEIIDSGIAVAVYQKKSEYGPASALVQNLTTKGHDFVVDPESLLTINNRKMEPSEIEDIVQQLNL